MASAAQLLGWGRGWPNCDKSRIVVVEVGARDINIPFRREMAPLLAGLVLELEAARGFPFTPGWCWGYACRPVKGTTTASNHSQGTSPDLDAPVNPHMSATAHALPHPGRKRIDGRYLRTNMPDNVSAIAAKWGFNWGGRYRTKPDPMHFDPAVTPAGAAQLIHDLRTLDGRPPSTPRPEEDIKVDIFSSPSTCDGHVVVHGQDDALWYKHGGGAWIRVGGGIAKGSSPSINRFRRVENHDGVPIVVEGHEVVVTGLDGRFYRIELTANGWGAWRRLGGAAAKVTV